MDFSIPGSDSWDTTSNQETFIKNYFHKEQLSVSHGKNQKRKRSMNDNPVLVNDAQKKKKKVVMQSSPLITDESCYEPRSILPLQMGKFVEKTFSNNLYKSNNIYGILPKVKAKKKISKMKSAKPDTNAIESQEIISHVDKQKSPEQKLKQFNKYSLNSNEIWNSKKETKDQKRLKPKAENIHVSDDSDEEQLREEVRNCDAFKDIQKLMLEQSFMNILEDSETSNNDLPLESDYLSSDVSNLGVLSDMSNEENVSFDISSMKMKCNRSAESNSNKSNKEHLVDKKSSGVDCSMNEMLIRNINLKEKTKSSSLNKAQEKLKAAKFRCLNEKLYTETGDSAFKYFRKNPEEFYDYHCGYSLQVSKWPLNPVDRIISDLQKLGKNIVIADLGCGDAKIARTLSHTTVHSFDLIALNEHVTACDISKVPLPSESVDVAIFCLSLMGVNLKEYLLEAHRILKDGGILKIAEVDSRIEDVTVFLKHLKCFGFTLENQDLKHKLFVFLDFKRGKRKLKNAQLPNLSLRPCLYKKR